MKQFFKELGDMLFKPLGNDLTSWLILIFLWLVILLLVGICIWGLLSLVNCCWLPVKSGYGRIIATHFEEAHYTTTYVYNAGTKTTMPVTRWHPDAWKWVIEIDGLRYDWYVSDENYVKHKIGEILPVTYTNGRLWASLFIKTVTI